MDVSVILVNYNTLSMTRECVSSVLKHTKDLLYEIIIVDNASIDGSKEYFEKQSEIKYIYSPNNLGFGRANNLGVEVAVGRNILFLNTDTLLINNAIKHLSDYIDANPSVGACGGNLFTKELKPAYSYDVWFPSVLTSLNGLLHGFLSRVFAGESANFNYSNGPKDVAYITGADLMVKRDVISRLRVAFNPSFFMYYEDTELCYRIHKLGCQIVSLPDAKIIHLSGGSMVTKDQKNAQVLESRDVFFRLVGKRRWYRILCKLLH